MYVFQPERELLKEKIKHYSKYIRGRVLDVGAGPSDRYGVFFNCGEYVRMDIKKYEGIDVVGNAEEMPFADESFDSIVCTYVLSNIFDFGKAFLEFRRVLRINGIILLAASLIAQLHDEPNDYWRFTEHSLKRLFGENGFEIMFIDKMGGFFSVKAQMNIRYMIEKFNLYHKWYGRLISLLAMLYGKLAMGMDKLDKGRANKSFCYGWLIVARKIK